MSAELLAVAVGVAGLLPWLGLSLWRWHRRRPVWTVYCHDCSWRRDLGRLDGFRSAGVALAFGGLHGVPAGHTTEARWGEA